MHRKTINISTVLAGQRIVLKEVDDGIGLVSLMQYDLGYVDLEARTRQIVDNPFGAGAPVRGKSVTYLSGTFCYLCVRVGHTESWRRGWGWDRTFSGAAESHKANKYLSTDPLTEKCSSPKRRHFVRTPCRSPFTVRLNHSTTSSRLLPSLKLLRFVSLRKAASAYCFCATIRSHSIPIAPKLL